MTDSPSGIDLQLPPPPPPPPEADFVPPHTPEPSYIRPERPRPTLPQLPMQNVAWLVVAALLTNLALRTQVASLSSTLAVLVIVGPLLGNRFRTNVTATTFSSAALVFAIWLPLRASTWLTSLNACAAAACLIAAAATVHPISLRISTRAVATVLSRIFMARFFFSVLQIAGAPLRRIRTGRLVPVARGVAIAVVPVMVFGALLASADAVFAQAFSINLNPSGFFGHAFITVVAAAAVAGLIAITSQPQDESFEEWKPLGSVEALVLLLSVGALYAAFAIVQLLSAVGRTDHILDQQGVTYSEYARNGFFQLLWVAGLTIVLLGLVRLFVADDGGKIDAAVRLMGATVAALTTLIVVVAIVRLGLYTSEFGQTTLRWYCTAFAWMLGALFVALAIGHLPRTEALLPAAIIAIVAITLFSVNVLNPEARVAEHNLSRTDATEPLDAAYLARLSADAWPELLDDQPVMSNLLGGDDALLRRCLQADDPNGYGIFGFNLARSRLNCDRAGS